MTRDQDVTYARGYAFEMDRYVITPSDTDLPLAITDPWRIRIFSTSSVDSIFIDPLITMEGVSLNIDYTFSPEQTELFASMGVVTVVIERGEHSEPFPRVFFKMTAIPDLNCKRVAP